jgi:hypothetical protein
MGRSSKPQGPAEASTKKQLATVRAVFERLGFRVDEAWDAKTETSFFTIDTGVGELESLRFLHRPGFLVAYAVMGVTAPAGRRAEVERFAARFNAGAHHGCVVVRSGTPVRIVYRVSVDYGKVKDLEAGYVASLVEDVIDTIPAIDVPLILIAKGTPADEAIARVLELEEVAIEPPRSAKSAAKPKKTAHATTPKTVAKRTPRR